MLFTVAVSHTPQLSTLTLTAFVTRACTAHGMERYMHNTHLRIAVLLQQLWREAAERAQHRPARVDYLNLSVPRKRFRVGREALHCNMSYNMWLEAEAGGRSRLPGAMGHSIMLRKQPQMMS